MNGLMHRSEQRLYSFTLSALARNINDRLQNERPPHGGLSEIQSEVLIKRLRAQQSCSFLLYAILNAGHFIRGRDGAGSGRFRHGRCRAPGNTARRLSRSCLRTTHSSLSIIVRPRCRHGIDPSCLCFRRYCDNHGDTQDHHRYHCRASSHIRLPLPIISSAIPSRSSSYLRRFGLICDAGLAANCINITTDSDSKYESPIR